MSMRPLAALGLAGLFVLACVSLTKADVPVSTAPSCVAKDQIIEKVMAEGVKFRKVVDGDADALTRDMKANNVDLVGKSYIVFWKDGPENKVILITVFDEHNCYAGNVRGPRDEVLRIIGGVGA